MQDPQDPRPPGQTAPPRSRIWLRRMPLIVIVLTAIFGTIFLRDQIDFATLARHHAQLTDFRDVHYGMAVLGFMLAYIGIVAFSLPGATVATLAGGFLFGLFPGAIYNALAAGTGAILVFLAARAGFGAELAARLARGNGAAARLLARLGENEWSVLFLMRLVPVVPFFLANLMPAVIGTRLWRYAVTTYLGILPGAVIFTSVGAGLGEVFARGEVPDLALFLEPRFLLPTLGLILLAALPMLFRTLRRTPG